MRSQEQERPCGSAHQQNKCQCSMLHRVMQMHAAQSSADAQLIPGSWEWSADRLSAHCGQRCLALARATAAAVLCFDASQLVRNPAPASPPPEIVELTEPPRKTAPVVSINCTSTHNVCIYICTAHGQHKRMHLVARQLLVTTAHALMTAKTRRPAI